jgi:putative ABC transport system ATP-binding protein
MSTGRLSAQSTLLSAPADVSPESPALIAVIGVDVESDFLAMRFGNAIEGSSPYPAVREVPKNSTVTFAPEDGITARGAETESPDAVLVVVFCGASRAHPIAANTKNSLEIMLIANEVTREYRSGDQEIAVLRNVSFTIPQGAFVAIVGPSGSGKTTLLGLLAGLDTPTRGKVILDGHDLTAMSENERAKLRGEKVGFVFQSFQLIPTLTARENIQVPLELQGTPGATERADELLGRIGLEKRGHHFPMQLSGGEQQRVAIARAFANSPRILFADEPTGNLDANTGARVFELLESLNREAGSTIVLVTHDAALAERAGRTIRLSDGAIVGDTEAAA